jgi:hypothetical protein
MNPVSADSIREAIAGGDYARAQGLWNDYAGALAAGGLSESSLSEAAELMEWSRQALLCARAHAVDRLRTLHVAAAYGGRATLRRPLLRASF